MRNTRRAVVGNGDEPMLSETAKQSMARLTARANNNQKSIITSSDTHRRYASMAITDE